MDIEILPYLSFSNSKADNNNPSASFDKAVQKLAVYPNPAESSITVNITSAEAVSNCRLDILNAEGVVVVNRKINLIKEQTG